MADYKNTLNLPKTDFPMKANLAQREPEILKKWDSINLYQQCREHGKNRQRFVFPDGPPYANGHIHMGHAVNKVLKDIVVKSKTFSGFDVPYVPGWDCHGLPIEVNVEKKVGKPGQKISVAEFRKACREYAQSFVEIQMAEFKRLGLISDWEHPYRTMDYSFEANIIRSLAKVIKNGFLLKGAKPVHWCLDCSSALAEAEVEYKDKTSPAIDVRFTVIDEAEFLSRFSKQPRGNGPISIPIWTTTPWTLPANQAVALNPTIDYVVIDCDGKERLVVAESLLPVVMQRYEVKHHHLLAKIPGEKLENIKLQHPFYDRQVPVVLGDHVTVDAGTGAVHTAPAHGQDDFEIGKKYHLPVENPVGDNGCFIASTPLFAGMHVNKVNDLVIEQLKTHNKLLHFTKVTHSYPHCWRHKTPLIFRATPQWFIDLDKNKFRATAVAEIKKVTWVPEWGQGRIMTMVENRPDWCISRQRAWGTPITLFIHKETGEPHPDTLELMEKVAQRVDQHGADAWFDLKSEELIGRDAEHYKKCEDILDVWFDSGVVHECILRHRPEFSFPADLYLEGSDQHRGWFQSSLLSSVAMNHVAPYKTVLTHGYVIDLEGQKMSKSLGNGIAPEEIIQSMGADVLRLWVASVDYRSEIALSQEILTRTSETYRRIRNTARFLLANLEGFDPAAHLVKPENMLALDRYIVDKARSVQNEIVKSYEAYQFHLIYQKIHQFCSIDLGSFYLDIIKDRQYTTQTNSLARRSTQTAMFHIIEALVRWMAPILSFTAEEIWQFIPGKRNESVFLNTWYADLFALSENEMMNQEYWETIQQVRNAVNKELEKLRNEGKLGAPLEADVKLYCEPELKVKLDALQNELRFVLITSKANVELTSANSHVVGTDVNGLWLQVTPLSVPKCERCWHRSDEVGKNAKHPTLCARCVENVDGAGEVRKFA